MHLYSNDFSFDKNGCHIFNINILFTYVIQAIFHSRIRTAYLEWHISLLHRNSTVARRVTNVTSEHYGDP